MAAHSEIARSSKPRSFGGMSANGEVARSRRLLSIGGMSANGEVARSSKLRSYGGMSSKGEVASSSKPRSFGGMLANGEVECSSYPNSFGGMSVRSVVARSSKPRSYGGVSANGEVARSSKPRSYGGMSANGEVARSSNPRSYGESACLQEDQGYKETREELRRIFSPVVWQPLELLEHMDIGFEDNIDSKPKSSQGCHSRDSGFGIEDNRDSRRKSSHEHHSRFSGFGFEDDMDSRTKCLQGYNSRDSGFGFEDNTDSRPKSSQGFHSRDSGFGFEDNTDSRPKSSEEVHSKRMFYQMTTVVVIPESCRLQLNFQGDSGFGFEDNMGPMLKTWYGCHPRDSGFKFEDNTDSRSKSSQGFHSRQFTMTPVRSERVHAEGPKELVHFICNVKGWPRVYKSQKQVHELTDRCSRLEAIFGLSSHSRGDHDLVSAIDIYLDISLKENAGRFPARKTDFEEKETVRLDIIKEHIETTECPFSCSFAGILVDKNGVKLVRKITQTGMFVLVDDTKQLEQSSKLEIDFSVAQRQISSLLEQIVFRNLRTKLNILRNLREGKDPLGHKLNQETKLRKHRHVIDQLLGEMIALFKRSTLPLNERPVVEGFEQKQVSKELEAEISKLDDKIRGYGFRYSTFVVNIEHCSDEKERTEHIKTGLEKHGIYDVQFNFVTKSVEEFKHLGAEISARSNGETTGTLGAFAVFTKEDDTACCALFSKHLTNGLKEGKLYTKEGEKMDEIGQLIKETLGCGGYDIAAAKLHPEYKNFTDERFKNSDNEPKPGLLYYRRTNKLDLQDLPVHIWGAKTKPGYGIIDVPELRFPESTETYIQVKDKEPPADTPIQRMAFPGDSGSIICADDLDDEKVHVISMLIGSNSYTGESENPDERRTYITFPLQEGIDQLQNVAAGEFSLVGIY